MFVFTIRFYRMRCAPRMPADIVTVTRESLADVN